MKNKMMRIASILMVAVLLTVCAVSSTFAKYVTTANAADNARVAKWGVVITAEGALFDKAYLPVADGNTPAGANATAASTTVFADENVVAPGTKSAEDAYKFTISGTPEVALETVLEFADDFTDVVLPAGTYYDFTGLIEGGKFTLSEDYHPVKFTLKEGTTTLVDAKTLAELVEFVEDAGKTYAPGTEFNTSFTLSWEWKFEELVDAPSTGDAGTTTEPVQVADATIDAADTFLGNVAAGIVDATSYADYGDANVDFAKISTKINFAVTISAVQVD